MGSDAGNQKLSENRAGAVRDWFTAQGGISAQRRSVKGYGKAQPVADNATEAGRQRNRRVEVQFTSK